MGSASPRAAVVIDYGTGHAEMEAERIGVGVTAEAQSILMLCRKQMKAGGIGADGAPDYCNVEGVAWLRKKCDM